MMVDVDINLKIPSTIPFSIMEQYLMFAGEVDIGFRPATLPSVTHVFVLDCRISHFILFHLTKMFMATKD